MKMRNKQVQKQLITHLRCYVCQEWETCCKSNFIGISPNYFLQDASLYYYYIQFLYEVWSYTDIDGKLLKPSHELTQWTDKMKLKILYSSRIEIPIHLRQDRNTSDVHKVIIIVLLLFKIISFMSLDCSRSYLQENV